MLETGTLQCPPPSRHEDQPARERIINSLDETLFVEAGAGTGKTTSLVGRIVSLISRGKTTIERIAAITFTEAAASELRDRVRQELEESASDPDKDEAERQRCKRTASKTSTKRLSRRCTASPPRFCASVRWKRGCRLRSR